MVPSPPDAMPRPDPKSLVSFFSRGLSSFQSSSDAFRVLCTLPHAGDPAPRRPAHPVKHLVVLDSSFNPPTRAHAGMARAALDDGARLLLLLSVNNADKAPKPAAFPVRLAMMDAMGRQLLGEVGGELQVDLAVTTMPFFHDKARALAQSDFYSSPPTTTFLAGFDTLVRVFDAKYYAGGDEGMRRVLGPFFSGGARLRVTARPDERWGGAGEQRALAEELVRGKKGVSVVEGEVEDETVSSSLVREVVGRGGDVGGLVGEEVKKWIEEEGLYREQGERL
ncbi:hypothetical protein EDB81DRAFT_454214 [Dactylonectria macrodidyma]|uniref:Nicotinamide-nucleotide adenylyltransferase n=1 Tax=Dactylonectria macrodidyma TaxID=307937 RepID=A0A9P9F5M9_9HYPO|nr:hypothetical protein EDB81DRAFT_454214 [Dactylonectria macrodidyma]